MTLPKPLHSLLPYTGDRREKQAWCFDHFFHSSLDQSALKNLRSIRGVLFLQSFVSCTGYALFASPLLLSIFFFSLLPALRLHTYGRLEFLAFPNTQTYKRSHTSLHP